MVSTSSILIEVTLQATASSGQQMLIAVLEWAEMIASMVGQEPISSLVAAAKISYREALEPID